MGNEYGIFGGGGYGGYAYGINRSGWKKVSDGAQRRMEEAKRTFYEFVKIHDFGNLPEHECDFKFTKKHAIPFHVVTTLRPKFNKWVRGFGAKPKWVKLTLAEKKHSQYKHRKSAISYCDITIDRHVRAALLEREPDAFQKENLLAEISLFTHLKLLGVPEIDALYVMHMHALLHSVSDSCTADGSSPSQRSRRSRKFPKFRIWRAFSTNR